MRKILTLLLLTLICVGGWAQTNIIDPFQWNGDTSFPSGTESNGVRYYDKEVTLNAVTNIYVYYRYSGGNHALAVKRVELLKNDVVVSFDEHENASTGNAKNHCTFKLNATAEGEGTYTLRTYATGSGGWDTRGNIYCYSQVEINSIFASIKECTTNHKVGYPKSGTSLANNITEYNTEENEYTQLCDYIYNVYNNDITNTQIPEDGKAYKLNFLHNNAGKTKRYIKYNTTDGLGLTTDASEAVTILFTEVDATNHKYIMTLPDGNLITWQGDGNEGFKNDGSTVKGYSTMVANQNDKDDWNLCWFTKQGTTEAQLGTIKMISRRGASATSCWVISNDGAWAKANEASFFGNNGATSALQFEEVAGVTSETEGYKDGVEKYTLYTTAKTNNSTYASHFGEGLNQYHFINKDDDVQTTGYMDAVKACTTLEQERSVVNSIAINQPAAGTFLRIRNANTRTYMSCNNNEDNSNRVAFDNTVDASKIFYYDGHHLLAYKNGFYVGHNGAAKPFLTNITDVSQNHTYGENQVASVEFAASPVNPGTYNVIFQTNRYLYDNGDAGSDAATNSDTKYTFWLEEVTTYPLMISEVGYATYANNFDNVKFPEDVEVYYVKRNGGANLATNSVVLTRIEDGIVPKGIGVILHKAGGYTGTVTGNVETEGSFFETQDNSLLLSTDQAVTINYYQENTIYVLSNGIHGVGFYPLDSSSYIPGFRAFLFADFMSSSGAFTLSLPSDDDLTNIEGISEIETENKEYRDLNGNITENPIKGQVYIFDGKVIKY